MAEFVEVMKQKKRMCDSQNICSDCQLFLEARKKRLDMCDDLVTRYTLLAEEIIMKWAEEHPVKTNADKFKEVFGFEPDMDACIANTCEGQCCSKCDLHKWWYREFKEAE